MSSLNLAEIADLIRRDQEAGERTLTSLTRPRQPEAQTYTPQERFGFIEQRGKELIQGNPDRDPKVLQAGIDEIREWKTVPDNYPVIEDLERLGSERIKRLKPEMERGVVGDVGSWIARGGLGAAETGLRALRTLDPEGGMDVTEGLATEGIKQIEGFRESTPFLRPKPKNKEGWRRWISEGVEAAVQSLTAGLPGAAAGAAIGSAVPVIGTAIGGLIGFATGAGVQFGLAEYDSFMEEAKEAGISKEKAQPAAILSGLAEGGFEFATDLIEGMLLGITKPLTRTAKSALKGGIKELFKKGWGQHVKRLAGVTGTEMGFEAVTAGTQAELRADVGLGDMKFWEAAQHALGPAAVASIIFGGLGTSVVASQQRSIQKALENKDAKPAERLGAAEEVGKTLKGIDPDLAFVWGLNANEAIQNKQSIDMGEDLFQLQEKMIARDRETTPDDGQGMGAATGQADEVGSSTPKVQSPKSEADTPVATPGAEIKDIGEEEVRETEAEVTLAEVIAAQEAAERIAQEQQEGEAILPDEIPPETSPPPEADIPPTPPDQGATPGPEVPLSVIEDVEGAGEAEAATAEEPHALGERWKVQGPGVPGEIYAGLDYDESGYPAVTLNYTEDDEIEVYSFDRESHETELIGTYDTLKDAAEAAEGWKRDEHRTTNIEQRTSNEREELEAILRDKRGATEAGQTQAVEDGLAMVSKKGDVKLTRDGLVRLKELRKGEEVPETTETAEIEDVEAAAEPEEKGLPPIVTRALKETFANIGQLSTDDLKALNKAVKEGVLSKGKGGPFPAVKTVYAEPGYDFEGERKKAIAEMTGAATAEPFTVENLPKHTVRKHKDQYGNKYVAEVTEEGPYQGMTAFTPHDDKDDARKELARQLNKTAKFRAKTEAETAEIEDVEGAASTKDVTPEDWKWGDKALYGDVEVTVEGKIGDDKYHVRYDTGGRVTANVESLRRVEPVAEKSLAEASVEDVLAVFDEQTKAIEKGEKTIAAVTGVRPGRKKARAKLKEAGEHVTAIGDLVDRMNDILGTKGEVGPGEEIDQTKWAQLQPLLKEAWDHAVAAGKNIGEFVQILVKAGLDRSARPYIERFVKEQGKEPETETKEIEEHEGAKEAEPAGAIEGKDKEVAEGAAEEPGPAAEKAEEEIEVTEPPRPEAETAEEEAGEGAEEEGGPVAGEEIEDIEGAGEAEPTEVEVEVEEETEPETATGEKPEKKEKKKKVKKLTDVGEDRWKRSSQDNRERTEAITIELDEVIEVADASKVVKALLKMTQKGNIFKIELPEGATPGTRRFLNVFRRLPIGFLEYAGALHGGGRARWRTSFKDALESALSNDPDGIKQKDIFGVAAQYISTMELLNESTKGAMNIAQARDGILKSVFKDEAGKPITIDNLRDIRYWRIQNYYTENGEIFGRYIDRKQARFKDLMTATADLMIATETETDKNLPITRTRRKIFDIETDGKHRDNKDVTGDDLVETFGLGTVAFGDWTEGPHRQQSVNLTFDALHDLMDTLGAPAMGASFNETTRLGIMYGARGRGGRAAATWHPDDNTINLTKMNGDGSLSHEWAHGLDGYGKLNMQNNVKEEYRTYNPVDDLKHALRHSYVSIEEIEKVADQLLKGLHYSSRRGRDRLEEAKKFLKESWESEFVKRTKFFTDAKQLDAGSKKIYWADKAEMFARAFEAYIADQLQGSNNYLVDTEFVAPGAVEEQFARMYGAYPSEAERERFNDIYAHFFEGMEWSDAGIPTMKKDYVPVTLAENFALKEKIDQLLDKLEEIYNNIYKGTPSEDGLYWYAYKDTNRGVMMQPDGAMAYDDEYKLAPEEDQEFEGQGAAAYPESLHADDVIGFSLTAITHEKTDKTIYWEGKDGAIIEDWIAGEAALGEASSEDDKTYEEGGGVSGLPPGDTGSSGEGTGGPGDTEEDTTRTGLGDGDTGVDIPTDRGGDADTVTDADALQSAGAKLDYSISPADNISNEITLTKRFTYNLTAIKLLKELEANNRLANAKEQAILVKFSGWGGLGGALEHLPSKAWQGRNELVKRLLTEDELRESRTNSLDAFYTPPAIYDAMYRILGKFGFTPGRIFESSLGIGHAFGAMPVELRKSSSLTGIELDGISARIAKQLYQNAGIINEDFQKVPLPDDYFDLFISNVPFGSSQPHDKKHNPYQFLVHDYFINKGLNLLRPGGLMAVLTSTGTMDKIDTKAREEFARKADFIGAIRLPNGVWGSASNVGADILFMRKKSEDAEKIPELKWKDTNSKKVAYVAKDGTRDENTWRGDIDLNEYFDAHPESALGEIVSAQTYRGDQATVIGDMTDIGEKIDEATKKFPDSIYFKKEGGHELDLMERLAKKEDIKDGAFYVDGDTLYINDGGTPVPFEGKEEDGLRIRGMINIRGIVRELLRSSVQGDTKKTEHLRKKLNSFYDAFVKKHGRLNEKSNYKPVSKDPDAGLWLALEKWNDEDNKFLGKEAIFEKDYLAEVKPPESAGNVSEGLVYSLNFKGRLDLNYIASLTGLPRADVISGLKGKIFNDPQLGYVVADEYLSGNVKEKLKVAEQVAELNEAYKENVIALKEVLPVDIPSHDIRAQLGSAWMPTQYIWNFINETMNYDVTDFRIEHLSDLGLFNIVWTGESKAAATRNKKRAKGLTSAINTWGTARKNFFDLIEVALNGGSVRVSDRVRGRSILNATQTDAAIQKLTQIQDRFRTWLWEDDNRSLNLVQKYNDLMNTNVDRDFDGSHLTLPGKVPDAIVKLRSHQLNSIWRYLQTGIAYFAHEVGTGKTYTVIASVMEARRLGLAKKPIIGVISKTMNDYKASFQKLYPGANVLYTELLGSKAEKRKQLAKMATGDYDAIVMTQEAIKRMPLSPEAMGRFVESEIRKLEAAMIELQSQGASQISLNDIENAIRKLRTKLQTTLDLARESMPTMEELGIDMMVVDEAHAFKNLDFHTKHGDVKGIKSKGSDRSMDLLSKFNYMHQRFGRGIILASGTPLTNSVGELYTISRYLQPKDLDARHVQTFDAWANTFGVIGSETEYSPEGAGFKMVKKFRKFINIPELMQMTRKVLDIIHVGPKAGPGIIEIPRPDIRGGKATSIVVPQNPIAAEYQQELRNRAMAYRADPFNATWEDVRDNMLRIIGNGQDAATDPRMIDPNNEDHEDTKTNYAVKNIIEEYEKEHPAIDPDTGKDYMEKKGTQLIFLDRGVPGGSAKFNVYADIKKKLMKQGIPAKEIAFIHDVKGKDKDLQLKKLFAKVRKGDIRILIGSTQKLGIGVNVQDRVIGIHHIDVHWNFANYEQRNGRGLRFGNRIKEIFINNYGMEATVDAFMWDKNASKGRVLGQVLSRNPLIREVEDVSRDSMTASEFVSELSGDPIHKERVELEQDIRRMNNSRIVHERGARKNRDRIAILPGLISGAEAEIVKADGYLEVIDKINGVQIGEEFWAFKPDGGKANKAAEKIAGGPKLKKALSKDIDARKTLGQFGTVITEQEEYIAQEEYTVTEKGKKVKKKRNFIKTKPVKKFKPVDAHLRLRHSGVEAGPIYEIISGMGIRMDNPIKGGISRLFTNTLNHINGFKDETAKDIKQYKAEIPRLQEEVGKPFEQRDELIKKEARFHEITQTLLEQQRREEDAYRQQHAQHQRPGQTHEVDDDEDVQPSLIERSPWNFADPGLTERQNLVDAGTTAREYLELITAEAAPPSVAQDMARFLLLLHRDQLAGIPMVGDQDAFTSGYFRKDHRVVVAEGQTYNTAGMDRTMIHETVHGLTVRALNGNQHLKKDVEDLLEIARGQIPSQDLKVLKEEYRFDGRLMNEAFNDGIYRLSHGPRVAYGLLNVHEFLAQAFADIKFQEFLRGIQVGKGPEATTLWERFVEFVSKALGLNKEQQTLLAAVLSKAQMVIREDARNIREGAYPAETEGPGLDQIIETNNPNFRKWFRDSKVVDEKGEPLVVYHGTDQAFTSFKKGDIGFHFGNIGQADERAGIGFSITEEPFYRTGTNIMPVYLSLQNPLTMDTDLRQWDDMHDLKYELGPEEGKVFTETELSELKTVAQVTKALIEKGYDGIIYENAIEVEGKSYIAFNPTQIKSIHNRGTFDTTDNDIYYSLHEMAETEQPPTGEETARDLETDRSFANTLFEMKDLAVFRINKQVKDLQLRVQDLTGKPSQKRVHLGIGYQPKLKRSRGSDDLDKAMLVYRDMLNNPDKADTFREWAEKKIKAKGISAAEQLKIKGQLRTLDQAEKLTPEQVRFTGRMGELFENGYQMARSQGIINAHRDNYVRRLWRMPEGKGGYGNHGFKTFTTAALPRTLETVLDGWMKGYELRVEGITSSYNDYMTELTTVMANRAFVTRGVNTRDVDGSSLFSTDKLSGYAQLAAEGFSVWRWKGGIKAVKEEEGQKVLTVNTFGRKFFATPPDEASRLWAVHRVMDDGETRGRAQRLFESQDEAKEWAGDQEYETDIKERPPEDVSELFEKVPLYAPAPLADMINRMTATDTLFNKTPVASSLLRFNAGLKSWILMSSFFHHLAGARSWVFGVHHGWKKANPMAAYKSGLRKIDDLHPLLELGIKQGLTLGQLQDWSEYDLRQQKGYAERILNHLGMEKAIKTAERLRFMRESWADSLFKKFFAGLKAEAFVLEYTHELSKATKKYNHGKIKTPPDPDQIAERIAQLINADFGGLHLGRLGRNPTLQKMARALLLAPDWTESNFRTVTGMIPGVNKWISKLIQDVPPPKGMENVYRRFWGRVMLRIAVSTIIAQMLMNGKDDTDEFIEEQMLSNRFNKFRWTEIDISKLYEMLGVDLEGQRKTFSLGGHFFDPLKLIDPWRLVKGKGSPLVRIFGAGFSGSDWAERPFTGATELVTTGKTIKKSAFQETEGAFNRLPSTLVNQLVNNQPIQIGQLIRYLQGESDGLTALSHSVGAAVHTAWKPRMTTPVVRAKAKEDRVYATVERLMEKDVLKMGPPSRYISINGDMVRMGHTVYTDYLERSSRMVRYRMSRIINTAKWSMMNEADQADVIKRLVRAARKRARSSVKRQVMRKIRLDKREVIMEA